MEGPSLPELEAERERLYAQLSSVGDFRRGSVTENSANAGSRTARARSPIIPGTGRGCCGPAPRAARSTWPQLAAGEVAKVRRELERYAEFASISEQIVEVSEKICEARPPAAADAPSAPEGEKGG